MNWLKSTRTIFIVRIIEKHCKESSFIERSKKLAVITGGTTGIGFEIALGLARCNYRVVIGILSSFLFI